MVLAPENPLVDQITTEEQRESIESYRTAIAAKSDLERTDLAKEKTGVFTGAFAINPANDERIPIWIADYVMMGYGTGAIMGVPAHDERDLEFARKFELRRRAGRSSPGKTPEESIGYTGVGIAINSPLLDGLSRRGSDGQDHRLAGAKRTGTPRHSLQAARLAFLAAALLGRAVSDHLARWQT